MAAAQLQRRWVDLTSSLLREGVVDDQFRELQRMQDESSPDFVFEIMTLYFQDSERILAELGGFLNQRDVDFSKVEAHVHQLKGSSASAGAQRVKNLCVAFRSCCKEGSRERCIRCLQQVKQEVSFIKGKFDDLFKLEKQILAAGGSIPTV